jgi:DNA-binding protein H-NS
MKRAKMSIDIDDLDWSAYPIPKLQSVISRITEEIERQRDEKRKILLEQVQNLLSSEGLTLDDIVGTRRRTKQRKRGPVPVKYRDPETGKGWSGRGRKPVWIAEKLEAGMTLEDFAVESPPAENPDTAEEEPAPTA